MRGDNVMLQNGTFRGHRTSRAKKFEFNFLFAGFAGLALILAIASMREPFMVSRIVLFALAVLSAAAPFIFFAVGVARHNREQISNAISRERRHDQTRVEIRRTVKAMADALTEQRAANDDPQAWNKAVERFANENVFPAISHSVPRSERDMWVMEIRVIADTFATKPSGAVKAPMPATEATVAFIEDCAGQIAAAGWETRVEANRVLASLGASSVLFECLGADATVDERTVEAFLAQRNAHGIERGAIIAVHAFTSAALQIARANGMGLIKPAHVPAFLEWAARGSEEPARAAN